MSERDVWYSFANGWIELVKELSPDMMHVTPANVKDNAILFANAMTEEWKKKSS